MYLPIGSYIEARTRVAYQSYTSHFSGIGIIPPPLGWYHWYLLVGIAVLSMVGILVGITVQAIFT